MNKIAAHRSHDFSYGHRVNGHTSSDGQPGKCSHLHGHNGRVTFHCEAEKLDDIGRVIDFSVIKERLVSWVEENWDHKFLVDSSDPWLPALRSIDREGVVTVPFNPTAENMASFLLNKVGPFVLEGTGVTLVKVELMETRKCGVEVC